jgi:DNA-binding CsgD family transcriptional regulator
MLIERSILQSKSEGTFVSGKVAEMPNRISPAMHMILVEDLLTFISILDDPSIRDRLKIARAHTLDDAIDLIGATNGVNLVVVDLPVKNSKMNAETQNFEIKTNLNWEERKSDPSPKRSSDDHSVARSMSMSLVQLNHIARPLSAKEMVVATMIVNGHTNKAIAGKLDLPESTVKMHIRSIFRKIGARNRAHAAVLWREFKEKNPLEQQD